MRKPVFMAGEDEGQPEHRIYIIVTAGGAIFRSHKEHDLPMGMSAKPWTRIISSLNYKNISLDDLIFAANGRFPKFRRALINYWKISLKFYEAPDSVLMGPLNRYEYELAKAICELPEQIAWDKNERHIRMTRMERSEVPRPGRPIVLLPPMDPQDI